MRSSVDPAAVGAGYWQLLENVRFTRQSLQTRLGCVELTLDAVDPSASYRGHWLGKLNGTETMLAAYRIGTKTRIYKVNLAPFSFTFTELSSDASSTRFTNDGDVTFACVRDPGFGTDFPGLDYVYISNGNTEQPLAYTGTTGLTQLKRVGTTLSSGAFRPGPRGYFKIQNSANIDFSYGTGVSGDPLYLHNVGTGANNNEVEFQFQSDALDYAGMVSFEANSCVNYYGTAEHTSSVLDLSQSEQLWLILHDNALDPITNYVDITVKGPTQFDEVWIYRVEASDRIEPVIIPIGGGYYLAGIGIDPTIEDLDTVNAVTIHLVKAFPADRTFKLSGVIAGGRVPNGCDFAVSYAQKTNYNESAGVVPVAQRTLPLSSYGCSRALPYALPQNDSLYYQYRIDYGRFPGAFADMIALYRQEPGDTQPLLTSVFTWTTTPPTVLFDNVRSVDRSIFRPAPSAATVNPKSASVALGANNRLYLGNVSGAKSQIWISDDGFPWRFRPLATDEDGDGLPDPNSGISVTFPGEEVSYLLAMPGSFVGIAPVVAFTNQTTWRLEGIDTASLSRPTKLTAHGTVYPRTVAEFRGTVCFLDSDLIVRRLGGGVDDPPLSLYKVDDQLEKGDVSKAAAFFYKERYGLAHRAPSASINQRVLLYEILAGEWCRDAYTATDQNWAGFCARGVGVDRSLIAFTNEGRIFQLEAPDRDDDNGTPITISLATGELHEDLWTECFWGRLGVVCDSPSEASFSTTRVNPFDLGDPAITTGTIDVGGLFNRIYRWDGNGPDHVPTGIDSPSCIYQISGAYPPGYFIKAIVHEFDSYGVDRADVG